MKLLKSTIIGTTIYFIIGSITPREVAFPMGQYFYIGIPIAITITYQVISNLSSKKKNIDMDI